MSNVIRPEVSKNNKYWISKHRYYELKHFCMQFPEWKKELKTLDGYKDGAVIYISDDKTYDRSVVEDVAQKREFLLNRVKMLEEAAKETDPEVGRYILRGAIWEISYDVMNANEPLLCSRDRYYDLYRKFFWLLDSKRR